MNSSARLRSFASALLLFVVGCDNPAPTGQASAALVGVPVSDGGEGCTPGQTVCNVYGTALYTCAMVYQEDGVTPYANEWLAGSACALGCMRAADAAGLEHDYCAECTPGDSRCVGHTESLCSPAGKWTRAGICNINVCPPGTHMCPDEGCQKICT